MGLVIPVPEDVKFGWFITNQMRTLPTGGKATFTFFANERNRLLARRYMSNKTRQFYSERFGVFKMRLTIELILGEIEAERVY